ncbi:MAG: UDP-N-acetylglucosamine 2-epimerase (non-hydrolyzing) [Acidobacteria bacterium]|nr:MAG: UDP-N-acetylglucosamine 2-epimerase (non-hydrolyzing) [Acidobacteriota bacterium]
MVRIACVAGARPNFVKVAPLRREMLRRAGLDHYLVHTGQHYDAALSEQFFEELKITAPDAHLGVGSGTQTWQVAEVMRRLEPVLEELRPDLVVVVGDVNSTLGAALTAAKMGLPVAHMEAGLRSFDRTMPEEINRMLIDRVSDLLFVTEESGRRNLLREGADPAKIHFVGNVMIDALEATKPRWLRSNIFERLGLDPDRPYALLTLHRPSNVDDDGTLAAILGALGRVARELVLFPVHPRTRPGLERCGGGAGSARKVPESGGIVCLEPLGYLDCIALMSRARLVLTDSGGIQEETTALGVACLTLRNNTERPVTVTHGTNRVIGTDRDTIVRESLATLAAPPRPRQRPPLWDGRAARRIVNVMLRHAPRFTTPARRLEAEEASLAASAASGAVRG